MSRCERISDVIRGLLGSRGTAPRAKRVGGTRAAKAPGQERTVRVGLGTGPRTHAPATASAIPTASMAKNAPMFNVETDGSHDESVTHAC